MVEVTTPGAAAAAGSPPSGQALLNPLGAKAWGGR